MGDIRKVIVNGEEFEVELEQDGENWTATVGGQTFEIKVPDAGPAPKQRRTSGGKSKKSGKVSANGRDCRGLFGRCSPRGASGNDS